MDITGISHSLIPEAFAADPFWNKAARDVFSGLLHFLYRQDKKSNRDIWRAVTAGKEDMAKWLSTTPGGESGHAYIEDASSKQAAGVVAVMMQYAAAFEFMAAMDGDFKLSEWLEKEEGGMIYITNYADVQDTLKPILSLFVDLLGRKLLTLSEDLNRRVFFMLDEFGTLQRLSSIVKLLTLSRSKGGSVWIGIQDTGQIEKIYTREIRQTIFGACGNDVIFSVKDPDTAEYLSRSIGETEYWTMDESYSMGVADNRDGISQSKRRRQDRLVLGSQIKNLQERECYLQIAGIPAVTRTTVPVVSYDETTEKYMLRPDFNLEEAMRKEEERKKIAELIMGEMGSILQGKESGKGAKRTDKTLDSGKKAKESEFEFEDDIWS